MNANTFTVISVSSNANSFGYRGLIILAPDGTGYEIFAQAYGSDPVPCKGDQVRLEDFQTSKQLPPTSPAKAAAVIKAASIVDTNRLIAVAVGGGNYLATKARIIRKAGHEFGIHKTLNKSTWSVTHIESGYAVTTRQPNQAAALARLEHILTTETPQALATAFSSQPSAPCPWSLEVHSTKVAAPKPSANIPEIVRIIAQTVGGLSDLEELAIKGALNSRTGQLKAKCPSADWNKAAWNGLQPNAWKIQFSACFLRGEPADLLAKLSKHTWPAAFDKDLHALRKAGVA